MILAAKEHTYLQTYDFAGKSRNFSNCVILWFDFRFLYTLQLLYRDLLRNWKKTKKSACVFNTEECGKVPNSFSAKLSVNRYSSLALGIVF